MLFHFQKKQLFHDSKALFVMALTFVIGCVGAANFYSLTVIALIFAYYISLVCCNLYSDVRYV